MLTALKKLLIGDVEAQNTQSNSQNLPTAQKKEEKQNNEAKQNSPKSRDTLLAEGNDFITRISSLAPLYDQARVKDFYTPILNSTPDAELPGYVSKLNQTLWDMSDLSKALMAQKLIAAEFHRNLGAKTCYEEFKKEIWTKLNTYQLSSESLADFKKFNSELNSRRKKILLEKLNSLLPSWNPSADDIEAKNELQNKMAKISDLDADTLVELEITIGWIERSIARATNTTTQGATQINCTLSGNPSTLHAVQSPKKVAHVDTDAVDKTQLLSSSPTFNFRVN